MDSFNVQMISRMMKMETCSYVTDYGNNRVQVLNFNGVFLRILVASDRISEPVGITYYQGLLCISQWKQNKEL